MNKAWIVTLLLSLALVSGQSQAVLALHFKKVQPYKQNSTVEPSTANYKEGLKRLKSGDYDGAIDSFLQAIDFARNKYNPDAYYQLGMAYKAKHEDTKAIEAFKKHLEQVGGPSPDARCELAEIYMDHDLLDDAGDQLANAIIEFRTRCPRAHYLEGKLAEKKGNLNAAQMDYEYAMGDVAKYTDAWVAYGEIFMKEKDWVRAIEQMDNIIKNADDLKGLDLERIYLDLGECQMHRGNHQGAMDSWKKALAINPDSPLGHLNLGRLFDLEQHISSAIEEYRAYLRVGQDRPDAQQVRDRLVFLEGRLKPAEPEPPRQGERQMPSPEAPGESPAPSEPGF